jgi:hypothetical protein
MYPLDRIHFHDYYILQKNFINRAFTDDNPGDL